MRRSNFYFLFLCAIFLIFTACKKDKNNEKIIGCTENFAFITVTVSGGDLDDFFTIREKTGDTIRNGKAWNDSSYIVLDDHYVGKIKNSTEDFTFKGFIGDALVVEELYKIKADDCHIKLVSGETKLNIEKDSLTY